MARTAIEQQGYFFEVQGFSLRRGHFITLFAPYLDKDNAESKANELRETNPSCKYRVVSRSVFTRQDVEIFGPVKDAAR